MKKRFLGIKIGTVLAVIGCLLVSVLIWLSVKYAGGADSSGSMHLCLDIFRGQI